jgi:putative hydrolase of the HAD superfamily
MITVVSFDLWGTLLTYGDRDAEVAWRLREFELVISEFGYSVVSERLRAAVQGVRAESLEQQRHMGVQLPVRDQVAEMIGRLGIDDERLIDVLVVPHTHAVLRACPDMMPGALTTLRAVRDSDRRLVLCSNTLATPATVTRQILDYHGLDGLFDDAFFSSDLGVAKPRREVFQAIGDRFHTPLDQIVHIGNDLRTDVGGAQAAGCHAIWFNPHGKPNRRDAPAATSLTAVPALIEAMAAQQKPTPSLA